MDKKQAEPVTASGKAEPTLTERVREVQDCAAEAGFKLSADASDDKAFMDEMWGDE